MLEFTVSELVLSSPLQSQTGSGLNRDMSRACMVAETLAWGVSHNMPLPEALKALPFYRNIAPGERLRGRLAFMRDCFVPFRPFFWLMNLRWSWNIGLAIGELERGEPLSAALEHNLRRCFPGFYLAGIAKAEADGRLDTALPVLARQLSFPAAVASDRNIEICFVAWKFFFALNILAFVTINIVPRFHEIFEDLIGWSPTLSAPVAVIAGLVLKTAILLIVGLFILTRIEGIGEYAILYLPFVGREWKRFVLSDLARSMAVFVRQGETVLSAAEWSAKSTRSHWLRKRLAAFTAALRRGENWVAAWNDMDLGTPLDQWLVGNAAAREDPASGFELLGEWLHQEIEFTTRRIERWIDPFCTLLLALVVGSISYQIFSALVTMIVALTS